MAREGLTPKQAKFVEEYLIDLNATQAAIRAGYSKDTAYRIGFENLRKPQIEQALTERTEQIAREAEVTPEKVLKELACIAFSDIRDMVVWDGERVSFKSSADLPDHIAHAISEISAETSTTRVDENIDSQVTKMKLKTWNKGHALEKLGQYLTLFTEKHRIEADDALKKIAALLDVTP